MRKLRTGSIVAVAVLGLALGACGDDDDAPSDDTAAEETDTTDAPSDDTTAEETDTTDAATDDSAADEASATPEGEVRDQIVQAYTGMGMDEEQANCLIDALGIDFSSIETMADVDMNELISNGQQAFSDCDINPADLSMGG